MIVESLIQSNIIDMFDILKEIKDSEEAKTKYAELLTSIIVDAIKSADISPLTVTLLPIPVQVVPASGIGATLPSTATTVLGTGKLI